MLTKKIVIKKYRNRRLYNTSSGQYVCYRDILELIKCGNQVLIVDDRKKCDITYVVFSEMLFHYEAPRPHFQKTPKLDLNLAKA
ncbi:MAG: hypothetical protein COV44_01080 [Deltaproteobacteria bacterium CG11_big_fil_rev_8_21_14_0_20_45_16]|nr:MAG: hypothetical protein COV44_01080 [Deltaproteobacteria bacterium CG11_big_fil_rev_8_21_14_0_20_45_16]